MLEQKLFETIYANKILFIKKINSSFFFIDLN